MENFVVSARKYRPVTFDSVVGQSHITTTLKNAIATNHLAQAFLFCGPRGVGKTTCARILAKTTNCLNLSDDIEPCGKCESCVSFQNNASINIHELDAASNNSVDDIRNLTDQVRYPPQTGKYKIYIIDEVHMLSQAAFNAFLKTLEEPPSYAIFILATTEKHKILPTILSRCQIFDFNRIQPKDISDHLASIAGKEGIKAEPEALELIAQKADGGLRDALSMFDLNVTFSKDQVLRYKEVLENLHILDYDYYFNIVQAFLASDLPRALVLFDEIIRKGFDGHLFIGGLMEHLRNLLVCKDPVTASLLQVSESARAKFAEQSQHTPLSFLLSALSVTSQCDLQYKTAKNQRLHIELCLMRLAHITDVLDLSSVAAVDETAKKKVPEPAPADNTFVEKENSVPVRSAPAAPVPEAGIAPDERRPLPPPPLRPVSKLKSVREVLTMAEAPEKNEPAVKAEGHPVSSRADRRELTPVALQEAIRDFLDKRNAEGLSSSTEEVALARPIELGNGVMSLVLDNDLQLEKLNEIKGELLYFLRSRFAADGMKIEGRVAPSEVKRMPYTPKEKFEYMVTKNETLIELKRRFGLEIDF
ncbi:MAG: DNA polymerase III, subunit gamma and tau [Cytophagaceae bacterium SCN 52-12]|nr:MAG: DNA polymerase III, subunit gamma and tau [Cytophagaceae bacterium SCN 52-12]